MASIMAPVTDGQLEQVTAAQKEKEKEQQKNGANGTMGYDQFLQLLCAEMQNQDPLEPTSNTDYVAQMATFSQVEATLSMADSQQNAVAHNLVGKQVILKVENSSTGKTEYVDGKVDYVMYSETGELMLSVNDKLYPFSSLDTVADLDYYEGVKLAQTFSEMVAILPSEDNLTSDYRGAVEEVREMYNSMTSYQQELVSDTDLAVLEAVEAKLNQILSIEKDSAEGLVKVFSEKAAALLDKDSVTLEDGEVLTDLREIYNGMTAYQREFLNKDEVEKFLDAEEKYKGLVSAEEDAETA